MSDLIERLRLNQGEIFGPTMQEAADEIERLQRENEEVMRQKAYQYQRAKKAEEELAALKAQSTEPFGYWHQGETYEESEFFLASESGDVRCDDCVVLYSTPPTAAALLGSLGNWVYKRMQQADSDYHNHGDDTAEVYATLKMVLSKIESMIEGENHGRHE